MSDSADLPPEADDMMAFPGMDASPPARDGAYRVLARKYRPQTFAQLIGQEAMVQTLGNAIRRGRIAHAFLMTGVRGVGKTSTARLIAKALNCIGPDGQGGPTIDPCGLCEPCRAITEGRHIDVIEMDAASNTGIGDIREIIEAVRYSAVSARYKIYIIDEVHMLSNAAFNGLLKTLEEPPPHVKFLFATTEANKVPVTVLSRCQRFDLKRIPSDRLASHFAAVLASEMVSAEADALALIAQAAEGSVRDGLSMLDQAIAHADMEKGGSEQGSSGATVTAAQVREMLGLSDRASVRRLFAAVLEGDAAALIGHVREQHSLGVEPLALIAGLLSQVHALTLAKVGAAPDPAMPEEARAANAEWAERLGFAELHRIWQLLLKGHDEVRKAALPGEACEMALLRVLHAASLPDPGALARLLAAGGAAAPASGGQAGAPAAPAPVASALPADPQALLDLLARDHPQVEMTLRDVMRVVDYAPPVLRYQLAGPVAPGFEARVRAALQDATGTRWTFETAEGIAQPSDQEQRLAAESAARDAIMSDPLVRAAFDAFPGARLIDSEPQTPSLRSLSR